MTKVLKTLRKQKARLSNDAYFDYKRAQLHEYCHDLIKNADYRYPKKSYFNAISPLYGCGSLHTDYTTGEIRKWYCKQRFCPNCNSIKSINAMEKYKSIIQAMPEKYFVTLTAKTVGQNQIDQRITNMNTAWMRIIKKAVKDGVILNGIKKLELVHSRPVGNSPRFHAHFHILTDSEASGKYIIERWLTVMAKIEPGEKISPDAQDIQKADDNSIIELFKYTLKPMKLAKNDNGVRIIKNSLGETFQVSASAELKRNLYMKHKRTYQSFGNLFNAKKSSLAISQDEVKPLSEKKPKAPKLLPGNYELITPVKDLYYYKIQYQLANYNTRARKKAWTNAKNNLSIQDFEDFKTWAYTDDASPNHKQIKTIKQWLKSSKLYYPKIIKINHEKTQTDQETQ